MANDTNTFSRIISQIEIWSGSETIARWADWYAANESKVRAIRLKTVYVLAVIYLGYLGKVTSIYVTSTQPFYFPGAVAEQILEYAAAKNYAQRGFWKDGLLADYATSSLDQDHPHLYTHQPSGPAILLGVLLKSGLSLMQARLVFAGISILGIVAFFFLILRITKVPEVAFLSMGLFSYNMQAWIEWSDHFVHAFGNLSYFGTLLFYLMFVERPSALGKLGFLICSIIGLVTSINTSIPTFATILLIHFILHRQNGLSKRLVKTLFATSLALGALLFIRNCLVLGFDVSCKDVVYTVANRALGWPSKESMASFFDAHRIVLWGVGKVDGIGMTGWLTSAIFAPLKEFETLFVLLIIVCWMLQPQSDSFFKRFPLIVIIFIGTYAWHVVFFAQGTIYLVPTIHRMFRMGVIILSLDLLFRCLRGYVLLPVRQPQHFRQMSFIGLLCLMVSVQFFHQYIKIEVNHTGRAVKRLERRMAPYRSFARLQALQKGTVFTNIDAVVTNFFTDNVVFGGCDDKALRNLDANTCPSSFVSSESKKTAQVRYLFLTHSFIPGYSTCRGECYSDLVRYLRRNHPVIMEESDWVVFEVTQYGST